MPDDLQLLAERAHLDAARACLVAMQASASAIADYGVDELASQSLGKLRAQRLRSLGADPHAPPFFGRIDREVEAESTGGKVEVFHVGRRHIRDAFGDPVVVDWRAPIARAFYRATPAARLGVQLRRRFGFAQGIDRPELTSYEDEHLDRGEELGLRSGLLREEIERPRVGPMRDIVATIQPDQDDLVRADLDESLCIQGAPGTGKTAVGLHRAAYLLYSYPDRLRRSGVLVIGPNRAFLDYIAQVLPSLGEGGIEQSTIDDLVGLHCTATEQLAVEVLKGDARMADVLRAAVLSYVAKPAEDLVVVMGTRRHRVPADHLRRYVDDARRALGDGLRWEAARDRLRAQLAEDIRRQREDAGAAPSDAETAAMARSTAVRGFVDLVWPTLSAPVLLQRLFADSDFLRRCSGSALSDADRTLLSRPAARSIRATMWTPADAPLLDELAGLLSPIPTFVHAVVDEAQDLSPMQCRAIARRCPTGSMTVLGDLAQATSAWAPGDWSLTLQHLGKAGAQIRSLTAGYRVPDEVLVVANRLLPHIAAGVAPATSIRHGSDALRFAPMDALTDEVRRMLAAPGSVGVIVADEDAAGLRHRLVGEGIDARQLGDTGDTGDTGETGGTGETGVRVFVVPSGSAKGLEFDSVVLVEPARIVATEASRTSGLRRLYVVLTRAVSRLAVVHDQPLPVELRA